MTKKSRREFFWDAAKLLMVPVAAAIVPATLEDILDVNGVEAQSQSPPNEVREQLSFNISLRDYDTQNFIVGRITRSSVGTATLNVAHTPTTYRIQISSRIDILGAWITMQSNLRGTFFHSNGLPQFQPQFYWLRYEEGGRGTTHKLFVADIHFDFSTHTSQSYGYHRQEDQATRRYGLPTARLSSRFHQSTRDLVSAMMQTRFRSTRRRTQLNTIVEGVPRSLWLDYLGTGRVSRRGSSGYPTRRYRIHFPIGILPDTSWDLHFQFHDAADRTLLQARLVKSDGSQVIFTLQNPGYFIPRTNLYAAP